MAAASYDQLLKQVEALKMENSNLRQELEDNSNHLTKLETEASNMKVRVKHEPSASVYFTGCLESETLKERIAAIIAVIKTSSSGLYLNPRVKDVAPLFMVIVICSLWTGLWCTHMNYPPVSVSAQFAHKKTWAKPGEENLQWADGLKD